ncbi:MAG: AraC family transcriptional regulator [Mucilaginibacter sp.]
MVYQTIVPPQALQPYVKYFWTLEDNTCKAGVKTFRTMADGCPGVIFQQADSGSFFQAGKQLPETFLFGQTTRYAEIHLSGSFDTVGVYFQPDALQTVFGYEAAELTDSCLDLNLFAKPRGIDLSDRLANTASPGDKVAFLEDYLLAEVDRNHRCTDMKMRYALEQIISSKGTLPLKTLQQSLNTSQRSFHRKFKQYTGIPPKLFSRICRFQASLKQLQQTDYEKLSDIAFGHEYADQSHFIRSFKEFSGLSPAQYQKNSTEVVENLSEIFS